MKPELLRPSFRDGGNRGSGDLGRPAQTHAGWSSHHTVSCRLRVHLTAAPSRWSLNVARGQPCSRATHTDTSTALLPQGGLRCWERSGFEHKCVRFENPRGVLSPPVHLPYLKKQNLIPTFTEVTSRLVGDRDQMRQAESRPPSAVKGLCRCGEAQHIDMGDYPGLSRWALTMMSNIPGRGRQGEFCHT